MPGDNLLVIDNLNELKDIEEIKKKLNRLEWSLLITSRANPQIINSTIRLSEMTSESLLKLFKHHYEGDLTKEEEEIILDIIKTIDNHTLLCELIAKIARDGFIKLEEISNLLKNQYVQAQDLQIIIPKGNHISLSENKQYIKLENYLNTIFHIVNDTFNEIEIALLRYFSIIPSIFYSFELLYVIFNLEEISKVDIYNSLNQLYRKGWILKSKASFKAHPLIKNILVKKLRPTPENTLNLIVGIRLQLFIEEGKNPLDYLSILPIGESILNEFKNENHLDLSVLSNYISSIYFSSGAKVKCLEYALLDLGIKEHNLDYDDFMLVNAYTNVSNAYFAINDIENYNIFNKKQIETSNAVITSNKKLNLEDPFDLVKLYDGMALNYKTKGNFKSELEYRIKSLEIRDENESEKLNDLAIAYDDIASNYVNLKNISKARFYSLKSLKLGRDILSDNHPDLISILNNACVILALLGKDKEALELSLESIKLNKENFEDHFHSTFGELYYNASLANFKLENFKLAREQLRLAIVCWEKDEIKSPHLDEAIRNEAILIGLIQQKTRIKNVKKHPRNKPCFCGSNKKYKHCHGLK